MQGPVGTTPPGEYPLFILLILTLVLVLGTNAMFLFEYCPPVGLGPVTKYPKTSLKLEPTHSLYSSEPKTYLNLSVSDSGMKSNSSTAAS